MLLARVSILALFMSIAAGASWAGRVAPEAAEEVARYFLESRSADHRIVARSELRGSDGAVHLHVFELDPSGFILVTTDTELPPVLGYSLRNGFPPEGATLGRIASFVVADVELRLSQVPRLPAERRRARRNQWHRLEHGQHAKAAPTCWPAAGTTATGGWVDTQWSQGPPYNDDCPMDSTTASRSVAGCPAVAMAQVLNDLRITHSTRFDDGDDYHHTYAGRDYWIDDDAAATGFPSFPILNASLSALDMLYASGQGADDEGAAALVFACGVAAQQVYTSSVSGTFGVDQAVQAYQRFGFGTIALLTDQDADLYPRMEQNLREGWPVHLAVVDEAGSSGHNVVVDGYCTDGTYHVNFGWGGPYDGWYVLPDEMPYGLTIVEGAIVDIDPSLFSDGFERGDLSAWSDHKSP
jgi:hypothetical protein